MKKNYFYVWGNNIDTIVKVKNFQEWYALVIQTANEYIEKWYWILRFSGSKIVMRNHSANDNVSIFHSNTLYLKCEETVDAE